MSEEKRGVYTPPENEYDRYDIGDEDDSRRGPLLLIVAIAIIIAFIAVIYTAYNQGVRSGGRDDAPLIQAPEKPIKSKPENPGGIEQPSTSGAAYDAMEKQPQQDQVTIAPSPEQPIVTTIKPVQEKPAETVNPVAKPVIKPVATPTPADGKFVVQIGSFRSEQQALDTWDTLSNRLPLILGKTRADVQRADLGAKGIYYRLRASSFVDRATANSFCGKLKSKGQDCIVVGR